jgi:sugar phosphate permease
VVLLYREPPDRSEPASEGGSGWKGNIMRVLFERDFLLMAVTGILLMLVQYAFAAHFVLYAAHVLNFPAARCGVLLGLAFMTGVAGRIGWSAASDYAFKANRRIVLMLIGIFGATVLVSFVFLKAGSLFWTAYTLSAFFGLTGLRWNAVYLTRVGEFPGKALAGMATGINFVIVNLGAMSGPPLFGYLGLTTRS